MKNFTLSIYFLMILFSCKTEYKPRDIESIKIEKIPVDSTSIRAIHVINNDIAYFAGANGKVGYTSKDGYKLSTKNFVYQDSIIPSFRSIASNGKDIFVLSIVNPALLYKLNEYEYSLVYKEKHEKVFYDAMKFFEDGIHGIAVGDPTEDCPSIIITEDSGENWSKIPCEHLPKFDSGEAFFAASNTNLKIIGNTVWMVSGGVKSRVYKSTDFGNTWETYETPMIQGNSTEGGYTMDFADENNGIIMGGDYSKPDSNSANKAITTDGGKTWTLVGVNQHPGYKSCVQYVPNTDGKEVFAVGFTGVSYSKDGGLTWKEVSKEKYLAIQFVDRNTAWLSGSKKMGKLILVD